MKVLALVSLLSVSQAITANWAICIAEDCNTGYKCCASTPPSGNATPPMVCVDTALSSKVIPSGSYTGYTYTCGTSAAASTTTVVATPDSAMGLGAISALSASLMMASEF